MPGKLTAAQPVGSAELDLSKASEVEVRLATAVQKLQIQAKQLQERQGPDTELTPEDKYHMKDLYLKMKAVEDKQTKLQDVVDADTRKKEERKSEAAQQRIVAMKITKERAPAKLRMQELRELNQVELMQEDKDRRYKDANEPKRVVPSGGLLGFGVAGDLLTKDFDYSDAVKDPWDGSNRDD